jgi:UDP-N-acetylglucosamine--N-acetylmuramyl-(pentapeptide) pyrophosphoryl-undecaprenol N-acetylglucosamine transferase
MKILTVGGGSGGHVTPVVAVIKELKKAQPDAEIRFWCDTKFAPQARALMSQLDFELPVQTIASGKFRRYHHLSMMRQLFWPRLVLLNLRDAMLVGAGLVQSIVKLAVWRPDVVFTKGGYVCLPVGLAAKLLRIPLVIHDSDAHPGLTNRVLSGWASAIATGAPLEYYSYPSAISKYVGIPIADSFHPFTADERLAARKEWGIDPTRPLVVVTGGGLGAQRINEAVAETLHELLDSASVVLISGTGQYDEMRALTPQNDDRYQLHAFVSSKMAELLGAADVVVTRAGATTILELAALGTPTILIPNGKLTGGHQLKNAAVYLDVKAVRVIDEPSMVENPHVLVEVVTDVLDNTTESIKMAKRFATFARPHAARDMADMILSAHHL